MMRVTLGMVLTCLLMGGGCGSEEPTGHGTLTGTVTDQTGAAVGDAEVTVGAKSATADFEGKYTLEAVAAGRATVQVRAPWYATKSETTTVKSSGSTVLDIVLDAAAFQVQAADLTLAEQFNEDFDWTTDTVSVRLVEEPTRRALQSAVYWLNPAFYREPGTETVTPDPAPFIGAEGGEHFDFSIGEGADEVDVLVASSIRDTAAATALPQDVRDAFLMWEPTINHLKAWDVEKATDLVIAGATVRQQIWEGEMAEPQTLEKVFVHGDELWVQIAFAPGVELGASITDSDGDGRKEIFARLNPALYTQDVIDELMENYSAPVLTTLGLRSVLDDLINALYDRTNPELVARIGEAYEVEGTGTFSYPFAVLKHTDDTINVLLVVPASP